MANPTIPTKEGLVSSQLTKNTMVNRIVHKVEELYKKYSLLSIRSKLERVEEEVKRIFDDYRDLYK